MLLGTADSLMVTPNEPLRKSWFTVDLMAPFGPLPHELQYAVEELPEGLMSSASEPIQHKPFNSRLKYPGFRESVSATLQMRMFEFDPAYFFFRRWRDLVHPPGTSVPGLYRDICGQGMVQIFAPSPGGGVPTLARRIHLVNVWPSSLRVGALSRNSDGEHVTYLVALEIEESEHETFD